MHAVVPPLLIFPVTVLLRSRANRFNNTRILNAFLRLSWFLSTFAYLKIPIITKIKVIVELTTFRQRINLLKNCFRVNINACFAFKIFFKNQCPATRIAANKKFKEVITVKGNSILNKIMKV